MLYYTYITYASLQYIHIPLLSSPLANHMASPKLYIQGDFLVKDAKKSIKVYVKSKQ
jgi:hypothetical protein